MAGFYCTNTDGSLSITLRRLAMSSGEAAGSVERSKAPGPEEAAMVGEASAGEGDCFCCCWCWSLRLLESAAGAVEEGCDAFALGGGAEEAAMLGGAAIATSPPPSNTNGAFSSSAAPLRCSSSFARRCSAHRWPQR